jgi:hypothetical protein
VELEAIYGGVQAIGRYAMGSNEPLGTSTELGDDTTGDENTESFRIDLNSRKAKDAATGSSAANEDKERGGKRRKIS